MKMLHRIIATLILVIVFTTVALAQNPIPNPGFENWTDGNPDEWAVINIPGFYVPVTQSVTSHSGSSAVKGEVVSFQAAIVPPTLVPAVGLVPITQNYTRLTGYYQLSNAGEDALYAEVVFYDAQMGPVAGGSVELGATSGGYQMFTVDMEYVFGNQQQAANAYILFALGVASESSLQDPTVGSYFLLDDLNFDMVSALDDQASAGTPDVFSLAQNYPNPFNPATTISFSLPSADKAVLTIYNNVGQVVRTLLDENLAAGVHQVSFDAASLPSGLYFYKLEAGSYKSVKRMMLVK